MVLFLLSLGLNLLLFLVVAFSGGSTTFSGPGAIFTERTLSGNSSSEKIAIIRLEGLISSSIQGHVGIDGMVGDIREQMKLVERDDKIKAVVIRIDSPGGEVLASDQIYRAIKQVRDKTEKPVVISMGSVAASGGYYAAMGGDYIFADELTLTGSIGVIMQTINYKDLMGKVGVRSMVFKSGKFKDILSGSREPEPEEMQLIQDLVMETYDQFLSIVANERKLDKEYLRNGIADGRIFSGKQALAVKLVDGLGTLDDAIAYARTKSKVSEGARVIDYQVPFSLSSMLGIFAKSQTPAIKVELPQSAGAGLELKAGYLYYLSPHVF